MRSMALGTAVLAVVSISVPAYSDEGIFPGGRWWGEPLIESFCNGSVVLGPLIEIDASPTGVCGSSGPGGSESGVGHQLGRNAGGKVFAWGANYPYGQTSVPGDLPPCLAVAAGHNHSVALTQTGVVRCWGDNTYNQCTVPPGLRGVKAVTAGKHFTVALRSNDTAVVWGTADDNIRNPPSVTMTQIDAGVSHVVARRTTGVAVCWGNNSSSQCNVPSAVGQVTQVRAGSSHSVALRTDQTVRCWGSNNSGESSVPVGLNQVTGIAAGRGFTLALRQNGAVVAWGSLPSPVPSNLPPATKIVASGCSAFAFVSPTTDCNQDGIEDDCQLGGNDCDCDGVLDSCQLASGDCNNNGIYDGCELRTGDCNGDGVLDVCGGAGEMPLTFLADVAPTPIDLLFVYDTSGSIDQDLPTFANDVVSALRQRLDADVSLDVRICWIAMGETLVDDVNCPSADFEFSFEPPYPLAQDIRIPCSNRSCTTSEDWGDASSVAGYPGLSLFGCGWVTRPGVTVVFPLSDEGPNEGNDCSTDAVAGAGETVEDVVARARLWGTAVIPVAFPFADNYPCVYSTETGTPTGWMQEIASRTSCGASAVDARDLYDVGAAGAIADALISEVRRAIEVSPRRLSPRGRCRLDFNGNGQVDAPDMAVLLNAWGTSAARYDLNCNGIVDAPDMAVLLNAWGPCSD